MKPVRLLLVLIAIASAAAPLRAGLEHDCFQGQEPELRIYGCSMLIQQAPNDTVAYHNRAAAYGLLGNNDQAIADYTKVIEIAPSNASAYANRSRAYANRGNYAQAAEDKSKALELMAKSIAQPTMIGPKANILPSQPKVKSPPKAKPTPKPEPPVKAVQVLKAEPPLKPEPAPKANDSAAEQSPSITLWSWLTPLNGKKEPPPKAAPAMRLEPAPTAEPLLKAEPAPNYIYGLKAPPNTLVGWLQQQNAKKEPPVKAASAAKVEPGPTAEPALKPEPYPDDDMDREASPDTLMAWLKQLNSKKAKP